MKIKQEPILSTRTTIEVSGVEAFILKSFLQYGLHRLNCHKSGLEKAIRENDHSFIKKIIEKL